MFIVGVHVEILVFLSLCSSQFNQIDFKWKVSHGPLTFKFLFHFCITTCVHNIIQYVALEYGRYLISICMTIRQIICIKPKFGTFLNNTNLNIVQTSLETES